MTHLEELQLIQAVLKGDSDSFEQLVLENQNGVYNLAYKMTSNESDALDISQEVFIKAYTNLSRFRGDSRFSVWLYRLTYNACIDLLRRKKRVSVTSLTVNDQEDDAPCEFDIPDIKYSPETQYERKETRKAVRDAVMSLPEQHRQVVIMREYSDMSYEEIARALHLTEGTVKSRLSRARQRLAKILIENGTFSDGKRQLSRKEGAEDE